MIYKKGRFYFTKFKFGGRLICKSARTFSKEAARRIEKRIRAEVALGNFGIIDRKPIPRLQDFLKESFLPYVETTHQSRPATLRYYQQGAHRLLASHLAGFKLDAISDKNAKEYAAQHPKLSPSTINATLRTLRRALNLSEEWRVLDRSPKIRLTRGEKQRDRILSPDEVLRYLAKCWQPLKDVATIILCTGMRPGEVFNLEWPSLGRTGWIKIAEGKSKAAKRELPMVPAVLEIMRRRFEEQGNPTEGFVFPAATKSGHTERDSLKRAHNSAVKRSRVPPFPPYILRHTALTNLATSGCDTFTLAAIAGHSSVVITQRYCHPQADAIERAFGVVTEGSYLHADRQH